jgi:hypothetical protein
LDLGIPIEHVIADDTEVMNGIIETVNEYRVRRPVRDAMWDCAIDNSTIWNIDFGEEYNND